MNNGKSKGRATPNAKANADVQRGERRRGRGRFEEIGWHDADNDLLKRVIVALTRAGCAVQFGKTKNGDSLTLRVVGDGDPYVEYCRPSEDITNWLTSVAIDYEL